MTTRTRTVRFGALVTVQEYAIILGCNPGGSIAGPPITIDWDILSSETVSLKAYERARRPLIRKSKQERTRILREQGFMEDVLLEAEHLVAAIRNARVESSMDEEESSDSLCLEDDYYELDALQVDDVNTLRRCADLIRRSPQGTKAMSMFQKRRAVQ